MLHPVRPAKRAIGAHCHADGYTTFFSDGTRSSSGYRHDARDTSAAPARATAPLPNRIELDTRQLALR